MEDKETKPATRRVKDQKTRRKQTRKTRPLYLPFLRSYVRVAVRYKRIGTHLLKLIGRHLYKLLLERRGVGVEVLHLSVLPLYLSTSLPRHTYFTLPDPTPLPYPLHKQPLPLPLSRPSFLPSERRHHRRTAHVSAPLHTHININTHTRPHADKADDQPLQPTPTTHTYIHTPLLKYSRARSRTQHTGFASSKQSTRPSSSLVPRPRRQQQHQVRASIALPNKKTLAQKAKHKRT